MRVAIQVEVEQTGVGASMFNSALFARVVLSPPKVLATVVRQTHPGSGGQAFSRTLTTWNFSGCQPFMQKQTCIELC